MENKVNSSELRNPTNQETKNKKVVSGNVKVKSKKKTGFIGILESFVSENVGKVGDYLINDVLVPTFKDAVMDTVEIMVRGEVRGRSNRRTNVGYYNYNDVSRTSNASRNKDYRSNVSKGVYNYDDVIFSSRQDAESVLMAMDETLAQYNIVKVSDYYEFAGEELDHASYNYGWTDLRSAGIVKTRDGWMIKLPRPLALD